MNINFKCKSPCKNCPYRIDAPLQLWHKEHYVELMTNDADVLNGKMYLCHKNHGGVCVGWLIIQRTRNYPSIQLRIEMIKQNINSIYLGSLRCKTKMYATIKDMVQANFPELLNKK